MRISSLDLLRGLAAFSVAIPHWILIAQPQSEASETVAILAVEVFFTLSGFVLAPQILACMHSKRVTQLRVFLIRRWMRTVPAFALALFAIAFLTGHLFSTDTMRYLFYVQNLFAQHNTSDFYPVAWSLSVEEWFYVLFPALLFLLYRVVSPQDRWCEFVGVLGFIAVVTAMRTCLGDYAHWGEEVRRVVAFRVDSIAYGFLLYLLIGAPHRDSYVDGRPPLRPIWSLLLLLLATVGALATTTAIACGTEAGFGEHLFPFVAAALGMSAIVFFLNLDPILKRHAGAVAAAKFLGQISYSLYLFHVVLAELVHARIAHLPLAAQLCFYVVITGLFCWLFYRYFERPILAARPLYKAPSVDIKEKQIHGACV